MIASADPQQLVTAFGRDPWNKPLSLFVRYSDEHLSGIRHVLVAEVGETIAGYVTLIWESSYTGFSEVGMPEISDLNVLPEHRRRGIGNTLLDAIERVAASRSAVVGLGVGLYADYGAAQRIYIRRGYNVDGHGIVCAGTPVPAGSSIRIDDDATLMLTRSLDDLAEGSHHRR